MNKNKLIIGIDISTRGVGFCWQQNEITKVSYEDFGGWKEIKKSNYTNVEAAIFKYLMFATWNKQQDIEIACLGLELSNFSNPLMTQRFALICGIIIEAFNQFFKGKQIEIKIFNANEWFAKFYRDFVIDNKDIDIRFKIPYTNLKREDRKFLSVALLPQEIKKQVLNEENKNYKEDLADSYWIVHYYQELIDTFEKSEAIKKQQIKVKKLKKKLELEKIKKSLRGK